MELTDFFHEGTSACKLKGDLKCLGWNGQQWVKLTVSEDWTDEINFFSCWYKFRKIKIWSKIFSVGMFKNECGQSGYGTLKMNRWNKLIFCMLVQLRKAKSWFKNDHGL